MEGTQKNKMAEAPMKKLLLKMGLPMIISMVLQALYNVIDSIFVANMGEQGAIANQALTLAFPIQILIIAIGVGTGIGLNALLSKSLGEKSQEKVNKVAGNGIFLSICIFIIFLLFGLFGSKWFISLFAGGNQEVIAMGTTYLKICTCLSLGSIGYTVYERFLQATGKTMLSTISQISGAVTNIVLDYIFIFPLKMGVAGAAWATVIGQFVSLFIAMFFHYTKNKEINGSLKYIKPEIGIIKGIYKIGISAAIMQALLSVMMAGMNAILGGAKADPTILVGSFGIYYKIQQIALFSAFGLSNTIISILSFNYGMKDIASNKLIISISREHGTGGKEIARKVAEKLALKFFDKEEIKKFAIENKYNDDELYKFYLSLDAEKDSIIKQAETIKLIASKNDCVIVGRCADYILKDEPNLIKVFLYAPSEYRINKIKEMYKDTYKEAEKHIVQSDKSRASYYEIIANKKWGDKENYDICLDCSIGNEKVVNIICDYINEKNK